MKTAPETNECLGLHSCRLGVPVLSFKEQTAECDASQLLARKQESPSFSCFTDAQSANFPPLVTSG